MSRYPFDQKTLAHIDVLLTQAIEEDIFTGDYSSLACFENVSSKKGFIVCKETKGVLAGLNLVPIILQKLGFSIQIETTFCDGDPIKQGEKILFLEGKPLELLQAERIILNFIQRLSGIASITKKYVEKVAPFGVQILDTRKTTPGYRHLEKWAVAVGGGRNHRMGLYDMIMLKDNHIDFLGGLVPAVQKVAAYKAKHQLNIPVEVEINSRVKLADLPQVVNHIDRVMLDNFKPDEISNLLAEIPDQLETEISGGIVLENINDYAKHRPDFISVGALTHSVLPIDFSMQVDLAD